MIHYLTGDATQPEGTARSKVQIIAHICNDVGAWGGGFTRYLSEKHPLAENMYTRHKDMPFANGYKLGENIWVPTYKYGSYPDYELSGWVANMIAQHGFGDASGPPIRYDALKRCLLNVAKAAKKHGATVHGPRFGTGIAGGSWDKIERIINGTLIGVDVFIYDLPVVPLSATNKAWANTVAERYAAGQITWPDR